MLAMASSADHLWEQKVTDIAVKNRVGAIRNLVQMLMTTMERKMNFFGHIYRMRDDRAVKMGGSLGGYMVRERPQKK